MPTNLIDPLQTELYLRNALAFLAKSYVGVRESGGDNKGPMVEMFQKAVDGKATREPWCAALVQYCIKQAQACVEAITMQSLEDAPLTYETEHVLTMWNKSPQELRREVPRPGDLLLWQKYDVSGKPTTSGHVGVIVDVLDEEKQWTRTVEGNTSGEKDDVREGDVVATKTRNIHYNYGSLRPLGILSVWG